MKTFTLIKAFCWLVLISISSNNWAQSQMEILKHWAPEVYQDVNSGKQLGRQFYSARDIPVEIDFDQTINTGDNWGNSHYQAWEQGQLKDRLTPPLVAAAYCSFVETVNFYFLGYGYYHAGDDSNLSDDRHENDWEMVMLCIKKDGSTWGSFQGMLTQFHKKHKQFNKDYNRWNGSHPKIYISANGALDLFSPSKHGHGIEDFRNSDYQDDQGKDAIVLQVADYGDNIQDVFIPGEDRWGNALRYKYKLVSINEMWGWRNHSTLFKSYTTFQGGVNKLKDGGNPPWDKGYFCDPINKSSAVNPDLLSQFATSSTYNYLDQDMAGDSYIYNPYYNNNASQRLIENPGRIAPSLPGWKEAPIGNGGGITCFHRNTFTLSAKGNNIGGKSDNGHFVYKEVQGDFEVIATLDQLQNLGSDTKAGLMIRESLAASSKSLFACLNPNKLYKAQFRTAKGSPTKSNQKQLPANNAPVVLKIKRTGNSFSTYYSTDGNTYQLVSTQEIDMDKKVYIGLAASSNMSNEYASVVFYGVAVNGTIVTPPVADFAVNQSSLTVGGSVKFLDKSENSPKSWSWAFEGGTPASSSIQNPTVSFSSTGVYAVSLTITNANGTDTKTKNGYITVHPEGVYKNLAPEASVSVSSEFPDPNYNKNKMVDGVIQQTGTGEWASNGETTPWAQLNWNQEVTLSNVKLYERPNTSDHITAGTLIFSDGSQVAISTLPNKGDALQIDFTERSVTWVKFQVTGGSGPNNGLSEFRAYGHYTSLAPNLAPSAEISVSSEYPSENWHKERLTDGISGQVGNGEWASNAELTPWAQLNWNRQIVTNKVVLYSRPSTAENIHSGTLTFSDGDSIDVGELPNNGAPMVIKFRTRTIRWVHFQVNSGVAENNGLAEFKVFGNFADPKKNLAPDAQISVSSEYPNENWHKEKLADGIRAQIGNGEWASNAEVSPWAQLNWDKKLVTSEVVLFGRPSLAESIQSGTLTFSDGSQVALGALPNNGDPLHVNFSERTITWVRFQVDAGVAYNNGLSEFKILGDYSTPKSPRPKATRVSKLNNAEAKVEVFPNPATTNFTVRMPEKSISDIEIYDLHGSLIYKNRFEEQTVINTDQLAVSGMMVIKVTVGTKTYIKKLCVK